MGLPKVWELGGSLTSFSQMMEVRDGKPPRDPGKASPQILRDLGISGIVLGPWAVSGGKEN